LTNATRGRLSPPLLFAVVAVATIGIAELS
jgi:hypothetical protein